MTYEEALQYMNSLHRFGIKLGNERFKALLERLGSPHRRYGIAHIAGTKGKGSTTAMTAAILQQHGFLVGGYFSPYVYDVRERVQVDGEMIPRVDLARLIAAIRPLVEEIEQTPLGPTTEFELKTAVGFTYFAEREVEYAAVEVGIGGRLDATNVVQPKVAVITNIGLDHMQILGDTTAKIAAEKSGIIKLGVPVVTAADDPDALAVIVRTAADRGAPLRRVESREGDQPPARDLVVCVHRGEQFDVLTDRREYRGLRTGLSGAYQQLNAACAVAAVEHVAEQDGFTLSEEAIRAGLLSAYVPGRLELLREHPTVIADGAHNAMAAAALAAELRRRPHNRLLLVVGMTAGHEPADFLQVVAPLADRIYATEPLWHKRVPAEQVAEAARRLGVPSEVVAPPMAAARRALEEAGPDDLVVITGSFYTVGDVDRSTLSDAPVPGA